jgi:hypothetical protein
MTVPTVDLRDDRAVVARDIDDACRDVGFFQVVGHGIAAHVADAAWDAAHEFFGLPLDDKLAVAIPDGDAYGYGPFKVERLAASLGAATPPDLKETFSVGPFEPPRPDLTDPAAAFVYSPNRWPSTPATMETAFRAYYEAMAALVSRVMSAMALGLGLDVDWDEVSIERRHSSYSRGLMQVARASNLLTARSVSDKATVAHIPGWYDARRQLLESINRTGLFGRSPALDALVGKPTSDWLRDYYVADNRALAKSHGLPLGDFGYPMDSLGPAERPRPHRWRKLLRF